MKYLKYTFLFLLLIPTLSYAITVPWNKTVAGKIYPPLVGDFVGIGTTTPYAPLSVVGQAVAEYFTSTSTTLTSTFPRYTATNGTTTNATSTNFNLSSLTASRPVFSDGTKNLVSKLIDLASTADISGILAIANGGTGQASFAQGWLHSDGSTLTSSTSPTVNYITATSTTQASTFPYASTTALTISGNGYFPGSGVWNSSGFVGIGTSTPIENLHVLDTASSSIIIGGNSDADSASLWLTSDSRSFNADTTGVRGAKLSYYDDVNDAFNLSVWTNGVKNFDSLTIPRATGLIGIGTTSPYAQLSVANGIVSSTLYATTSLQLPNGTAPVVNTIGHLALDTTSPNALLVATSTNASYPGVMPLPRYQSFVVASTTWTSTSSLAQYPTLEFPERITGGQCYTDAGTVLLRIGDGTNWSNVTSISTATTTVTFTSNNRFNENGVKVTYQIGTPASSPKQVNCTMLRNYERI